MATKLKARAPAEVTPGRIKGVLFGRGGSGKTWLALSFPRPYYIDTEGGADLPHYQARLKESGGAYFGKPDGSTDAASVLEQIKALATEKHDYKTLVIDSLSKVQGTMMAVEEERLGEKNAFGAYKKPAISWSRRLMAWLDRLDMNVWLIAHETSQWEGQGKDRVEVGKIPDAWEKWNYELHLALQVVALGPGQREAVVHKTRLQGFPLFSRFYLQEKGTDVAYAEFTKRYSRDFIEAAVHPVILATAEQCARIKQLLEVVTVHQDEQDKWFSKAGVSSFEELTADQAAAVIEFIVKKIPASVGEAVKA